MNRGDLQFHTYMELHKPLQVDMKNSTYLGRTAAIDVYYELVQ